jgi:hypothetical protein
MLGGENKIYDSLYHRVTKRCCLSLLTNSALVFESKCAGGGEKLLGLRLSANEYSCAHHVTWSPNNRWIYLHI